MPHLRRIKRMEILPYEPAMAERLTTVYNSAIRGVPHCYPVSTTVLTTALEEDGGLRERQVLVAIESQSIVGFAHVGVGFRERDESPERGLIQFLCYAPGHRRAGQALLHAAEDHVRAHGMCQLVAFHQRYRYPFYHLQNAYLSDRLGQVAALLGYNGYRRVAGEVFLDWPNYAPLEPPPAGVPAEMTVEWVPGRGARPGLLVRARQGERDVGACKCVSCAEYTTAEEAQDWLFVLWVGVETDQQGKGLGRHLLRRALYEMHGAGYRHASISTAVDNYRAALFYTNLRFHVVDWTYGLARDLGGSDAQ
jgi:GNAT superfamily N-acetyltransferase